MVDRANKSETQRVAPLTGYPGLGRDRHNVSALLLAGGRGQRMGGQDKGLLNLGGYPLVIHALESIRPQVTEILLSANRNHALYQSWGFTVIADEEEYLGAGLLAGLYTGLTHATSPLVLTLPCDSPFPPSTLLDHLAQALSTQDAEIAFPVSDGCSHQAFLLCRTYLKDSLKKYLDGGQRQVLGWVQSHRYVAVNFPNGDDFFNINTPEDLARVETYYAKKFL
jgi:molybdopterin-guanine dinucleotide biosynthesis protein A